MAKKKKDRVDQIMDKVWELDDTELTRLVTEVLARERHRRKIRDMQAATNWRVGDRVQFNDRNHMRVTGSVLRVNKRSLTIISDKRVKWRVHYGAVRPIEKEASNG